MLYLLGLKQSATRRLRIGLSGGTQGLYGALFIAKVQASEYRFMAGSLAHIDSLQLLGGQVHFSNWLSGILYCCLV